jgi:hypothetical protein
MVILAAFGASLAILSEAEPLEELAEGNLVFHMFQHFLIGLGGFFVGRSLILLRPDGSLLPAHLLKGGYPWAALFLSLFTFWHVPSVYSAAVLPGNELLHLAEHVSFFSSSLFIAVVAPYMSRGFKAFFIFLFGNMNSMMGVLYSVNGGNLFWPYPAYQQNEFGFLMSITGFLTMSAGTYLYFVLSEPGSASRSTEAES